MPTVSSSQTQRLVTGMSFNACTGALTPTYSTPVIYSSQKTKPGPTPRSKPAIPFLNPTTRSWSTFYQQRGLVEAHTRVNSTCASDGRKVNAAYVTMSHFQPTFLLPTPPAPNTALKLRTKIDDLDQNLGGYIGEYQQTASMFTSGARLLSNAWKLAHGRLPKSKKHYTPRDVSAAWLNTQFAVKPTIDDIFGTINALNNSSNKTIYKKIVAVERSSVGGTLNIGNDQILYEREISYKDTVWIRRNTNHNYINLGNPAEWIWEAIPFSFVVDWFIPIGSYINSFDSLERWVVASGTRVMRDKYKATCVRNYPSTLLTDYFCTQPCILTGDSLQRTIQSSIPFSNVPRIKNPFSMNHVLDALALLHLMYKK